MKLKRIVAMALVLLTIFALASCGETATNNYEGKAKVVFHLEGGTYKNSKEALTHYYNVYDGDSKIVAPETINDKLYPIQKSGYVIEGWYRVKEGEGENAVYSEKWDFSYDKVGIEGVTLYAKWKKDIDFTYTVCYINDDGELVKVTDDSVYSVDAGEKFNDYFDFSEEREDYTFLGTYQTESGEPWDKDFVHPGDESNPNVNVVAVYLPIKGDFNIVNSKDEFVKAAKGTKDIYLNADIDLGGAEFKFTNLKKKQLIGNGHKISNFVLKCEIGKDYLVPSPGSTSTTSNALCISLLGDLDESTIKDVEFENFTVSLDYSYPDFVKEVYFAPLSVSVKNSTISGVKVTGTVTYKTETEEKLEKLVVVKDTCYYYADSQSAIEEVTVNIQVVVDGE